MLARNQTANNPSMKAFINSSVLEEAAASISTLTFKDEFLSRPFLSRIQDDELKASMLFYAVAICHQTYALQDSSRNLYGWDYLEDGFLRMALASPELLSSDYITTLGLDNLSQALLPWFSHDSSKTNSTLDRIEERAGLMLQAATVISNDFGGSILAFLSATNHLLFNNGHGFYELLQTLEAFSDKHRKKSSFFLKLLSDTGIYSVLDIENIIPVMDYHMQRVLLRTGIVATDQELTSILISRVEMESDEEVRGVCIEAMRKIALLAGFDILRMNDVFYMLGRSCCLETPLCRSGSCSKEPCSLTITVDLKEHHHCLFESFCLGGSDDSYILKWHPMVKTHFY